MGYRGAFRFFFLVLTLLMVCGLSQAADVGRVKTSKGDVQVERAGKRIKAPEGTAIQAEDTLVTGADGSVGLSMNDNTLLSLGPNSVFVIEKFLFDGTTNKGEFESTIRRGTLSVVSGKLVKNSPEAVKFKTPSAILGARGTEFVVRVSDAGN
jgi:hypothetical protein